MILPMDRRTLLSIGIAAVAVAAMWWQLRPLGISAAPHRTTTERKESDPIVVAEHTLERASILAQGRQIGYVASTPAEVTALDRIRDASDAVAICERVLTSGTNEGRMYALALLRELNPRRCEEAAKSLDVEDMSVSCTDGCCGVWKRTLHEIVRQIRYGSWTYEKRRQ